MLDSADSNPIIYLTRYTFSNGVAGVHMSERTATSAVKSCQGTLSAHKCVAVPIEQYQAIRALHEIVYALEEIQNVGLVLTPAAAIKLSDAARQLYLARLKDLHAAKMGKLETQNQPKDQSAPLYSQQAAKLTATEMAVEMREHALRKAAQVYGAEMIGALQGGPQTKPQELPEQNALAPEPLRPASLQMNVPNANERRVTAGKIQMATSGQNPHHPPHDNPQNRQP